MKKRHKVVMICGFGALVYCIGIFFGISFPNISGTNKQQQNKETKNISYKSAEMPDSIKIWLGEIQPAAGGNLEEEK